MKEVSAGIIVYEGKILICRRNSQKSNAGLWEFPGGKLEQGETIQECLKREIYEELHLDIEVYSFFMQSIYNYPQGSIKLETYWGKAKSDNITFHSDHDKILWIRPQELAHYEFSPADIPIQKALQKSFSDKFCIPSRN